MLPATMFLAIDFAGRGLNNKAMKKKIFSEDDYKTGKWSGGTTKELAIFPEDGNYLDRNFIWRISGADSDLEESSFTRLPGFDRILMVLKGQVVLAHGDESSVSLGCGEQDFFDGAVKTKCFGKLEKDYNLIMAKGSEGRMEIIELTQDAKAIDLTEKASGCHGDGRCSSYGFYSLEGYTLVSVNGEAEMVKQDQQMVVNCEPDEKPVITLMGQGKCIFTEIIYDKPAGFFDGDERSNVEGSDFKLAFKLFLGSNRWSRLIRRERKKGDWYSPELVKKLDTLDRFYVTGILWLIGVLLCLITMTWGFDPVTVGILVLAFTAVDLLLISPLIYMLVLPKPICRHIRKPENLNEVEQKMYNEHITRNEHQDKLMYKYRDRSREKYEGMGDFIRKLNK